MPEKDNKAASSDHATGSAVFAVLSFLCAEVFAINYMISFHSWRGWFVAGFFFSAFMSIRETIKEPTTRKQ